MQINPSTKQECELIDDKLGEYNRSMVPATHEPTLVYKNYNIKNNGTIIAGINAYVYHWAVVSLDILFVDENHRGQGLGSALLQKVEEEAKTMGATLIHTDTFDFQALDFYLKHGFEIFGVLDDCPKDHKRYFLKKKL